MSRGIVSAFLSTGLLFVAACLGQTAIVHAKPTIIECQSPGREHITINLNEKKAFHHVLSCIRGEFVEDMTPCAPNGGFRLSAPTGTAGLTGVVDRWQDYGDHNGGITGHWMNPAQIYFSGGYNDMDGGYKEKWSLMVNRVSGKGVLTIQKDNSVEPEKFNYTCGTAKQKF